MRISLGQLKETPPPRTLYHYTSSEGLCGIIQSKSVWATIIHYLNDAQEFQHAISVARDIIGVYQQRAAAAEREMLTAVSDSLDQIKRVNICAFSLSAQGDLLSQWRAYCPPGGGYSIGFSSAELKLHLSRQRFWLAPCVYDVDNQRELLTPILDKLIERYKAGVQSITRLRDELLPEFFLEFYAIAPVIKHPSFAEEQEWRAVSPPVEFTHPQMRVRQGRLMPIPYFCLELQSENLGIPLHEVIVGPNPHQELAMSAMSHLFRGGVGGGVRPSFIPYRQF